MPINLMDLYQDESADKDSSQSTQDPSEQNLEPEVNTPQAESAVLESSDNPQDSVIQDVSSTILDSVVESQDVDSQHSESSVEMTDEEKQLIQAMIDDSYQQFYQVVKTNRQLTDKVLKNYADGRVFTGRQAYNMKMVDYLGGEEKVKTIAEELTGLDNLEIGHQRPSNFKDLFLMLEYAKFNGKNSITKSIEKITTPKVLYLWTY